MTEGENRPLIYERMAKVMADMGAVGKNKKAPASVGGYAFRGIDDVMAALQPALIKHEVFIAPEVQSCESSELKTGSGKTMQRTIVWVRYTFWTVDGSHVKTCAPGEGADSGDKSVNKAMASAMKYALTQTFCTPTEEKKDSEHDPVDLSGGGSRPAKRKSSSGGGVDYDRKTIDGILKQIHEAKTAEEVRTITDPIKAEVSRETWTPILNAAIAKGEAEGWTQ